MNRPALSTIPEWYHGYVNQVQEDDLSAAFAKHETHLADVLQKLSAQKWDFSYSHGKWTIKEMVQHIIDCERIFCYRALSFARGESASLPGFDENKYAAASNANARNPGGLLEELATVQRSTVQLFASFDAAALACSGVSNSNPVSVVGLGFILVGHALHHKNIILERYL